jgi:hypothetical protein
MKKTAKKVMKQQSPALHSDCSRSEVFWQGNARTSSSHGSEGAGRQGDGLCDRRLRHREEAAGWHQDGPTKSDELDSLLPGADRCSEDGEEVGFCRKKFKRGAWEHQSAPSILGDPGTPNHPSRWAAVSPRESRTILSETFHND